MEKEKMHKELALRQFEFELKSTELKTKELLNELNKVSIGNTQKTPIKKLILSDRDYEVLEFVMDMKFASLDEVCEKFFRGSPIDSNVVGYWYAKKRLAQLEQAGFLKSTKQYSESRKFYYATLKSYFTLTNLYPEKILSRPSFAIDGRTVLHDYLVLRIRLELEKKHLAHSWISDRNLKLQKGSISTLSKSYLPDGIYKPIQGNAVAFELEISLKAKSRYQDKIKRYVQWIREHRHDPLAFKKVHYVVAKDVVKKHLDHLTAMYPDIFHIEPLNNYIKENAGLK